MGTRTAAIHRIFWQSHGVQQERRGHMQENYPDWQAAQLYSQWKQEKWGSQVWGNDTGRLLHCWKVRDLNCKPAPGRVADGQTRSSEQCKRTRHWLDCLTRGDNKRQQGAGTVITQEAAARGGETCFPVSLPPLLSSLDETIASVVCTPRCRSGSPQEDWGRLVLRAPQCRPAPCTFPENRLPLPGWPESANSQASWHPPTTPPDQHDVHDEKNSI